MCERARASFLTLPIELVYRILDKLDILTLIFSTRNVCSRLNKIIDTYYQYQTFITLDLKGNRIGRVGAQQLAGALRNNTTLTTLNLANNQIGPGGARHLAVALRNNMTLTTLNLTNNQIGLVGTQHLADSLRNNKTLTTLNLRKNKIGHVGAHYLADALQNNTTLTTLNLSNNQIGPVGAQHLADALQNHTTLTTLKLGTAFDRPFLFHLERDILVDDLLSHQDGLPYVDQQHAIDDVLDWNRMTSLLTEQNPYWKPGSTYGYHFYTMGFLVGEFIQRIDPQHCTYS
ncbi:unnamed protein product [Rotaria magnacalcarata]